MKEDDDGGGGDGAEFRQTDRPTANNPTKDYQNSREEISLFLLILSSFRINIIITKSIANNNSHNQAKVVALFRIGL